MIAANLSFLPLILLIIFCLILIHLKMENIFFRWVRDHWFWRRSKYQILSSYFYLFGSSLIILSLIDLRGGSQNIKIKVPRQKTIILIDASKSMMVEDVKPNRFEKAIFLARHFVKKSMNSYISIVLFSDLVKQVVPFTDDYEFLDSKLSSFMNNIPPGGGSNLSQAIQESIGMLKNTVANDSGNLLILSDAEESIEGFNLKVPAKINIAFLGIGTIRGGEIPLKDTRNVVISYKEIDGKKIQSKLNMDFIKGLAKKIDSFQYWIADSHSFSTDAILKFFTSRNQVNNTSENLRLRPPLLQYFLIPGIFLFIISYILKFMKTFSVISLFLCVFVGLMREPSANESHKTVNIGSVLIQDNKNLQKDELIKKFQMGFLSKDEIGLLADLYLKDHELDKAILLYEELVNSNLSDFNDIHSLFNYGTALLIEQNIKKGVMIYRLIEPLLKKVQAEERNIYTKAMRNNVLLSIKHKNNSILKERLLKSIKNNNLDYKKKISEIDTKPKDQKSDKQCDQPNKDAGPKKKSAKLGHQVSAVLNKLLNDDRALQGKLFNPTIQQDFVPGVRKDW